jgi:prepilin-type N-terminal cleavage/methylation domain-containing protein
MRKSVKATRGFTLLELLVVITLVVSLIALITPSLSEARKVAIRAKCGSQVRQALTATMVYSNDFKGYLPYRDLDTDEGAHTLRAGLRFDLNKTFVTPYLQNRNLLFCPSSLITVRNPKTTSPSDYTQDLMTYQFHYIQQSDTRWLISPKPDLDRVMDVGSTPLWSCLTTAGNSGPWLGHDSPSAAAPVGINTGRGDGAVRFVTNYVRWMRNQTNTAFYYWGVF